MRRRRRREVDKKLAFFPPSHERSLFCSPLREAFTVALSWATRDCKCTTT